MGSIAAEGQPVAVNVSLQELRDGSVSLETLEQAFGPASLGIIIVRDLPPEYASLRKSLLSYASYLANLPAAELDKVEVPPSNYNVGWSCGKETLADGRYDTLKGSFYAQPIDHDAQLSARAQTLYPDLPEFTTANVWPDAAALPGFEQAFRALCGLLIDVAALVARSCDRYGVATLDGYRDGTLEAIVRGSVSTKARLLHYFPPAPPPAAANGDNAAADAATPAAATIDDDWCATHLDLGALTGLTSQMFVDEAAHPPQRRAQTDDDDDDSASLPLLPELDAHPDPKAGLWIQDRAGRTTQVHIPRDCLAFQTGQALEAITRGKFRAVPHFVRGGAPGLGPAIARNTLAVFTQPNLWDPVDESRDFAAMAKVVLRKTL